MQLLTVQQNRRRVPLLACCAPALVLIAMLLAGCPARPNGAGQNDAGQTADARVEYVGRVTDAQTQRGIAGAKITLEFAGAPPIVYTDGEGVFRFTVPSTGPALAGRLRVDAKGYAIYDRNVDITPSAPRLEDIRLNPEIVLPAPTPTPTPIAADILIAQFDASQATRPVEIGRRLEQDLERQLRAYDLDNVVVKVLDQAVGDDEQAVTLAQNTGSRAVIWGWYDDFGVSVRIVLADPQTQTQEVPSIYDLPLALGGEASAELAFVIRQVLPENVSFLSLFVIGHLYYSNNEYTQGRAAFDAAMASLPDNVAFENEAILHFFRARQMETAGSRDYDAIVCEYAAAIEQDASMAEAYNNLAIFFMRVDYVYSYNLPEAAQACLDRAGIDRTTSLFDQAVALQPDWAVPQYNLLALRWGMEKPPNVQPLKEQLQTLLSVDPTLSGAYIILGLIEADEANYAAAQEHLATALTQVPPAQSASVHAALAQVYLRQAKYEKARNEYQQALALNQNDQGARLGLAATLYRLGDRAGAAEMAQSIREYAPNAAHEMGVILQSRVAFDDGRLEQAAQLLNGLLQDPSGFMFMGRTALLHYLSGLLALAAGDTAGVQARLADSGLVSELELWASTAKRPLLTRPSTLDEAWFALAERCASTWQWANEDERQEVLVNGSCLPADLGERITALYDIWQDQLGNRFYDVNVVLGAACPYVFTYAGEDGTGEWLFDTTILYNIVGPQNEQLQARPLARFDGRLLIREVEPEQSWIDLLAVIGVGADGTVTTWLPQAAALRRADDVYLHLEQGDEVVVSFVPADPELADALLAAPLPAAASPAGAAHWWVVGEGYYVPYAVAEPEADATGSHREGGKP